MSGFGYHYLLCQHFSCVSSYGLSVAVYIVSGWKYLINILTLLSLVDLLIEMSPSSVVDTKFFPIFSLCFCPFPLVKVRLSRICLHSCAVIMTGLLSSLLMSFVVLKFDGLLIWGLIASFCFLWTLQGGESRKIGVLRGLGIRLGYWVGWVGLGLGWVVSLG